MPKNPSEHAGRKKENKNNIDKLQLLSVTEVFCVCVCGVRIMVLTLVADDASPAVVTITAAFPLVALASV